MDRFFAMNVRYTFGLITPESAEEGEYADSGWYIPGVGGFVHDDPDASAEQPLGAQEVIRTLEDALGGIDRASTISDYLVVTGTSSSDDQRRLTITAHISGHPRMRAALDAALRAHGVGR